MGECEILLFGTAWCIKGVGRVLRESNCIATSSGMFLQSIVRFTRPFGCGHIISISVQARNKEKKPENITTGGCWKIIEVAMIYLFIPSPAIYEIPCNICSLFCFDPSTPYIIPNSPNPFRTSLSTLLSHSS